MTTVGDKPKIDRTKYIIEKQTGGTIYKHYGDVEGFNFKIRRNSNCTIYILDYCSGMFVDDCENCNIVTGPIDGSIFIRTSKNCSISTISRQVRFRDCENIKIYTYCPTDPAVESSFNIFFAPYNAFFPHLKELFVKGKFDKTEENHIATPHDFTVDKVMGDGAPHFGLLPRDQFEIIEIPDGDSPVEEMYDGYAESEEMIKEKKTGLPIVSNTIQGDNSQQQQQQNIENMFDFNNNNNNLNNHEVNTNNNNTGFDYTSSVPLGMNTSSHQNEIPIDNFINPSGNTIATDQQFEFDEEEQNRIAQREAEAAERAKKIREKMEIELRIKNELRQKAIEYMNTFTEARAKKIEDNKKTNEYNERKAIEDKKELAQLGAKANPWEKVCENIAIKESDYKGSKDISRMRECIIKKKNDVNSLLGNN